MDSFKTPATLIVAFIFLLSSAYCEPLANTDNVCVESTIIRKEKAVDEPVRYDIKYDTICGILPCSKTRTEIRIDRKLKSVYEEVSKPRCCPGYTETPERHCAPICLKCLHGNCVRPGVCQCKQEPTETSPGFVGSLCNRFVCLAENKWGNKCDKECSCPENSYCSASSGACICRSGYRGANCSDVCHPSDPDCELPHIIEPDANILEVIGETQKLEGSARFATQIEAEEKEESIYRQFASYTGLNPILLTIILLLVCMLTLALRKLHQKNELYSYASTRPSDDYSSSSYYSSSNGSVQNRPRMPTPPESNFLAKNLNFDSATRNVLVKGGNNHLNPFSEDYKYVVDRKLESNIIHSQETSVPNIYSEDKADDFIPEVVTDTASVSSDSDHIYQVPRSCSSVRDPVNSKPENEEILEKDTNIYEEINIKQ